VAPSGDDVESAAAVLSRQGADAVFRRAWNCLATEVNRAAAEVAARLLDAAAATESGSEAQALRSATKRLQRAAAAGTPWTALTAVEALLGYIDDDVVATLGGLLDECPRLVARVAPSAAPRFIATLADLDAARGFLRRISGTSSRERRTVPHRT